MRRLNRIGQIDPHHRAGLELGGQKDVPPFAATRVKDNAVLKISRRQRRDPIEEFSPVGIGQFRVVGPLIAESVRCSLLILRERLCKEAWNAPRDRKTRTAAGTEQHSFGYFRAVGVIATNFETVVALRTSQK